MGKVERHRCVIMERSSRKAVPRTEICTIIMRRKGERLMDVLVSVTVA